MLVGFIFIPRAVEFRRPSTMSDAAPMAHGDAGLPRRLDRLTIDATTPAKDEGRCVDQKDQDVNPWSVSGEVVNGVALAIDYGKLISQFGTRQVDAALLERFRTVTGREPHKYMRRGVVFSHRDLQAILDRHETGKPFFLYTGRGPSSESMHLGHMVPFEFTKSVDANLRVRMSRSLTVDADGCRMSSTFPSSSC